MDTTVRVSIGCQSRFVFDVAVLAPLLLLLFAQLLGLANALNTLIATNGQIVELEAVVVGVVEAVGVAALGRQRVKVEPSVRIDIGVGGLSRLTTVH
ncbi:hypothetical protein BpHYR1_021844 [Brachionus plicatilis]|uniref:Uncharacterized protein n=1 Tax=Brachionus plicatilis TaxID=10195 RepID=A0A3M7T459_BRAPC|nr:hypothetical protein BpHYR1_021844 [Brachionus plicatilis]